MPIFGKEAGHTRGISKSKIFVDTKVWGHSWNRQIQSKMAYTLWRFSQFRPDVGSDEFVQTMYILQCFFSPPVPKMGSPYGVQALTIGQVCRIIVLRHRILTSMSSSHGRACPLVHILFTSSGWFNLHTCSMFSQVAIVERPDHNSTNPLDGIRDTQITPHQPISPLVNNWFYARLHLNAPTTHFTTSQSTRCIPATNRPHTHSSKRIPGFHHLKPITERSHTLRRENTPAPSLKTSQPQGTFQAKLTPSHHFAHLFCWRARYCAVTRPPHTFISWS